MNSETGTGGNDDDDDDDVLSKLKYRAVWSCKQWPSSTIDNQWLLLDSGPGQQTVIAVTFFLSLPSVFHFRTNSALKHGLLSSTIWPSRPSSLLSVIPRWHGNSAIYPIKFYFLYKRRRTKPNGYVNACIGFSLRRISDDRIHFIHSFILLIAVWRTTLLNVLIDGSALLGLSIEDHRAYTSGHLDWTIIIDSQCVYTYLMLP